MLERAAQYSDKLTVKPRALNLILNEYCSAPEGQVGTQKRLGLTIA